MLVLSGLISFCFVFFNLRFYLKGLRGLDIAFCLSLLVFPLCYGVEYIIHGAKHDYEFFVEFLRISFLGVAVFVFLVSRNRFDFLLFKLMVSAFCILGGVAGFYEWMQYDINVRVSVGTPLINMYGALMGCGAGLSFYYILCAENRKEAVLFIISFLVGFLGVLLSGSKIAMMSLAFVILLSLVFFGSKNRKYICFLLVPAFVVFFLFAPVNAFLSMAEIAIKKVEMVYKGDELSSAEIGSNVDGSVGIRIQMYKAAISKIAQNPVVGSGTFRFKDHFPERIESGQLREDSSRFAHVHNEFLQAWMSRGLLGLLSLVLIFIIPFFLAKRKGSEVFFSTLIVILVFFWVSMFEAPFNTNITYVFYVVVLGLVLSFDRSKSIEIKGNGNS
ncbi:MAG: O-antigen ligase family protein [Amphritea sp.]|nr:O-antigen ligase family protein [Amphritea sp.]